MPTSIATVAGDVLGSTYEFANYCGRPKDLTFFPKDSFATDDTILTCAVAEALLVARRPDGSINEREFSAVLPDTLRCFARRHPEGGYGGRFAEWIKATGAPAYRSLGNGSAMRVSPCALVTDNIDTACRLARLSALPTHNHPLGILGAVATVHAIFRFREGREGRERLKNEWPTRFGALGALPNISRLRRPIRFDETCPGTVPFCIALALNTQSWEDTVKRAVTMGGDCDTTAAIAGAVAGGAYPVPETIRRETLCRLPCDLRKVITHFETTFCGT